MGAILDSWDTVDAGHLNTPLESFVEVETVERYLERMKEDGQIFNEPALIALGEALNQTVLVLVFDVEKGTVSGNVYNSTASVHGKLCLPLLFHNIGHDVGGSPQPLRLG